MQKNITESIQELFPVKPEDSAAIAALEYVNDNQAGFSRKKHGKGFVILDSDEL